MLATTRSDRGALYAYRAAGDASEADAGFAASTWVRVPNPEAEDGCWWVSLSEPTGRERVTGGKTEPVANAVIGHDESVPVPDRALWVIRGRQYRVLTVLLRTTPLVTDRRSVSVWTPDETYELVES